MEESKLMELVEQAKALPNNPYEVSIICSMGFYSKNREMLDRISDATGVDIDLIPDEYDTNNAVKDVIFVIPSVSS